MLVFDICDFNREVFGAEKLAQRIADNFPRSAVQVLDRQTWYVAELPEPIPGHPSVAPTSPSARPRGVVPYAQSQGTRVSTTACPATPSRASVGGTSSNGTAVANR